MIIIINIPPRSIGHPSGGDGGAGPVGLSALHPAGPGPRSEPGDPVHPGPGPGFHQWALDMKLKWIGVDCGSADHPMNTIIRNWHPARFVEAEKKLKAKYGKGWDEMFPQDEYYQVMHIKLFPKKLVHAENIGGEIDKLSNQRCRIGRDGKRWYSPSDRRYFCTDGWDEFDVDQYCSWRGATFSVTVLDSPAAK